MLDPPGQSRGLAHSRIDEPLQSQTAKPENPKTCRSISLLPENISLLLKIFSLLIGAGKMREVAGVERFLASQSLFQSRKLQISLLNSLLAGNLGGDGRDQHCVASQAFSILENIIFSARKARQMRAFLIAKSLWRRMFELFGREFPKSLRPNSIKFRFLETRARDRRMNALRGRCGSAKSSGFSEISSKAFAIRLWQRDVRRQFLFENGNAS